MLFYITVFLFFFYHFYWKRRNLPSGPLPLPFIGNFVQLYYYGFEEAIIRFKKQYGDLHTIWFGETPIVTVNDYETIIDKFVKNGDSVAGRVESTLFLEVTKGGPYGIIFNDGPLWKDQRRFGLKVLRDLGMGKDIMQEKVLTEVACILDEIKENLNSGKNVIRLQPLTDRAIGSVINSVALGYRFEKKNESEFIQLQKYTADIFHYFGNPFWRMMETGPKFYRYLPVFNTVYHKMANASNNIREFLERIISEHRKELEQENADADREPRDYVEAFLQQQKKCKNAGIKDHFFTDEQMYGAVMDIWLAGLDTTATTLSWVIFYIILHQDIQAKIHDELNAVISCDRIITMADKSSLPYINAVITEVQRYQSINYINLLHRTLEDITIHGQKIPKDTTIVDNFLNVHLDEKCFKNADQFNPERFIDENGKFISRPEVMPFGVGKRSCIGEGLARMELFLFTANLLNQFKLTQSPTKPLSFKRVVGGTIHPEPYVVKIESRFK